MRSQWIGPLRLGFTRYHRRKRYPTQNVCQYQRYMAAGSDSSSNNAHDGSSPKAQSIRSDEWIPPPSFSPRKAAGVATEIADRAVVTGDENEEEDELELLERELEQWESEEPLSSSSSAAAATSILPNVGGMVVPPQQSGRSLRHAATDLPILKHTLLTTDEIVQYLGYFLDDTDTATDFNNKGNNGKRNSTFQPIEVFPPLDVDDIAPTRILVTLSSPFSSTATLFPRMRTMAEGLVRQLRHRDLQSCNVIGAQLGVEGADDRTEENLWMVVDCGELHVVHFQDAGTRQAVNLPALWTINNHRKGNKGFSMMIDDDEAMDDYVVRNPVPPGYGMSTAPHSGNVASTSRWQFHDEPAPTRKAARRTKQRRKPRRGR